MTRETAGLALAVGAMAALTAWAGWGDALGDARPEAALGDTPGVTARPSASPYGKGPPRVVSVTLATDEILLSLLPPERIVAVTPFASVSSVSNVPEEAKRVPRTIVADVERIVGLEPDLVFVAQYTMQDAVDLLRAAGVPVFRLGRHDSLAAIRRNVLEVGEAVGEREGAEALAREMDGTLERVRSAVAGAASRPRVLYYMAGGSITEGSGTVVDGLLAAAGGRNAAAEAGVSGQRAISVETAIEIDPDVILLPGDQEGDSGAPGASARRILDDPIWRDVAAVKARRVHVIPARHITCVSHFVARAAEDIARVLHPDCFAPAEVR